VGAVAADLVSADGDLDGLLERLAGVGVARAATVSIVSEAEKPECFHATFNYALRRIIPSDRAIRVTPPSGAARSQRRQRDRQHPWVHHGVPSQRGTVSL